MKRFLAVLLAVVLVIATMAGCGSTGTSSVASSSESDETPASGGVVTYALAAGWDTLTPGYWCSVGFYGTLVWGQLYDRLVTVTPEGYTPRGALSWEINEEKTVMTFYLDPDAKFSDGEPVTASDWVFSAKLLSDPDFGAPDYTKFNVIIAGTDDTGLLDPDQEFGIVALDDTTLQITFKEAMTFDTFFNSYSCYYFVLPEHCFTDMTAAEIAASDFWENPVASGAWTVESQIVNNTLTLVPNENYHLGAPKLDKLIFTVMDSSNFTSALMSGSIDFCYPAVSTEEAAALELVDNVVVETSATPNVLWFFNVNNQLISDANVRKAMNMAIDKELIASQLFSGGAVAVESIELYGSSLYDNDLAVNYDPDGAKALLDEAGWDYSTVIHIATPSGVRSQIATIIQQNLESIGMQVEVSTLDIGTMYSKMHSGEYEACMGGGTPSLDPLYFQSNLETSNINTSIIKTTDNTYHELAQKISAAMTEEEKLAAVKEYQDYISEQQAVIPIVSVYSYNAYSSRLKGIDPNLSVYYNDNTYEWYVAE